MDRGWFPVEVELAVRERVIGISNEIEQLSAIAGKPSGG